MARRIGAHISGWMDEIDLKWLYVISKKMNTIVEIGSWMGRSTYALCSGCKGTVYAVDHFQGSEEHKELIAKGAQPFKQFLKNLEEFDNVQVLPMASEDAANSDFVPKFVDMVFVDGGHDYNTVIADFKNWFPRTTKLFCGHDIAQDGVPKALKEFFGELPKIVKGTNIWSVWI